MYFIINYTANDEDQNLEVDSTDFNHFSQFEAAIESHVGGDSYEWSTQDGLEDNLSLEDAFNFTLDVDDTDNAAQLAFIEIYATWDSFDFDDRFLGSWGSDAEFAEQQADEEGSIPEWVRCAVDWDAAARDLLRDHEERDGYYFKNVGA